MSLCRQKQERMYEQSWSRSLAAGKEQQGNLQVNLRFLEEVDLLKPDMEVLEIGCGFDPS